MWKIDHVQDHVINFKQFQRIEYFHAGESRKKLSLNDKYVTLKEFVQYFHEKIETFAGHHFNLKHTDVMIDNLLESLRDHELVIVQDFSENYNCPLPDEPQSIHWTIQQANVYPVVTLRCYNKKIVEATLYLSMMMVHMIPLSLNTVLITSRNSIVPMIQT